MIDERARQAARQAFYGVFWRGDAWTIDQKIWEGIDAACMAYVAEIERRTDEQDAEEALRRKDGRFYRCVSREPLVFEEIKTLAE